MSLQRIGDTAQAAATELTVGALTAIKASGQLMTKGSEATVDIFGNVADTGKNLTGTVSNVTGTIADLTAQMQTKTKEAAKALAITEQDITRQKITLSKGKADVSIAKSEAETQKQLLQIQNEYEIAQEKLKSEQEAILAKLKASETQKLLDQEDNIKNQKMAYYYGFKQNNSKVPGFEKSVNPFNRIITNWCYSYLPEYFVTTNGEIIDIEYPKEMPNGLRPLTIMAENRNINNGDDKNIIIDFEMKMLKKWGGRIVAERVPIIKYVTDPDQNPIDGQMYYRLIWFVCPAEYRRGGKKRKTNKTHKKRKTNRKRTAARRHSRR